jgi:hypothetical protein
MMGCKHREIQTRGEVDIENIKYELTLTLIDLAPLFFLMVNSSNNTIRKKKYTTKTP